MQILALGFGDLDKELLLFRAALMALWVVAPLAWYRGARWMGLDRCVPISDVLMESPARIANSVLRTLFFRSSRSAV